MSQQSTTAKKQNRPITIEARYKPDTERQLAALRLLLSSVTVESAEASKSYLSLSEQAGQQRGRGYIQLTPVGRGD